MKIGVLGSGMVGQTLAVGLAAEGHDVMIGSEHKGKLETWGKVNPGITVGSFKETAEFAEVVVLAVLGSAAETVLTTAGAKALAGKPVLDTCNPISGAPVDGVLPLFTGPNESLMEQLQKKFPEAKFVKAFNSVGAAAMVHPRYERGRPTMFLCGDDAEAKATATTLCDQLGWDAADMGVAAAARAIEPLCVLWCILGFTKQEWTHAFALLHA